MKNPKQYDDKQIIREAKRQNIPTEELYVLNPILKQYLSSIDTTNKENIQIVKNHKQPVSVIYYNTRGKPISFHLNCYADGFRSDWNSYGYFDQFPPKTAAPLDTVLNMDRLFEFVKPLNSEKIDFDSTEYTAVVFFNRVLRSRNRRLVKEVVKNAELNKGKEFQIVYVNNDAFMFEVVGPSLKEN